MSRGVVRLAVLVAAAVVAATAGFITVSRDTRASRPNIVLIITDDQRSDQFDGMPFVREQEWSSFAHAVVNTPLCCPSRASILTGLWSHHSGVTTNAEGELLDEDQTLGPWLQAAGYRTALIGKYLNLYPFERGPYVPAGWDRWIGEVDRPPYAHYYDYTLIEDGTPVTYGSAPEDYETDVLGRMALEFVEAAPRPFFLVFAPLAPHAPTTAGPRHVGTLTGQPVEHPASFREADTSDKPAWIQRLPLLPQQRMDALRRRGDETLASVDDAIRAIVEAVPADTVIIYTSDNGFSHGEHNWRGKECVYEECIRVPLLVHLPGVPPRRIDDVVSNVDIAATIVDLADAGAPAMDGVSLLPLLRGDNAPVRPVLLHMPARRQTPPGFWAIRTARWKYSELATGERELYDLEADPFELDNRAGDPQYADVERDLAEQLAELRTAPPRSY